MENSSTDSENSLLLHPDTSKGSSVSSGLQEEYNELLKYAVVTPKWEQKATDKVSLPQLRMPADPVTTITQYSDSSSSCGSLVDSLATGRDSAMGSDALETDRPPKSDPSRQTNLVANSVSATDGQPSEEPEHNQTDNDIQQLGRHIDTWNEEYKAKILHQVASMKNKVEESQRRYFHEQQQGAKREIAALQSEISNLQELLHTYEKSVQRKDVVISNLTQAMQSHRSRQDMMKAFTQWKLRLSDEKRISFTSQLARRHYEHTVAVKSWRAWRRLVEGGWKERVERACQMKAQEVCSKLTQDYEATLAELQDSLSRSQDEITQLNKSRGLFEKEMKKAFMRSVCALNLEAMSMFQDNPGANDVTSRDIDDVTPSDGKPPISDEEACCTSKIGFAPPMQPPRDVRTGHVTSMKPNRGTMRGNAVIVKRHHPNIQNYTTQQRLIHMDKQPNTPVRNITKHQRCTSDNN